MVPYLVEQPMKHSQDLVGLVKWVKNGNVGTCLLGYDGGNAEAIYNINRAACLPVSLWIKH